MDRSIAGEIGIVLWDRMHHIGLHLDPHDGMPRALRLGTDGVELPLRLSAELVIDGEEVPCALGGLEYLRTERLGTFSRVKAPPAHELRGPEETYTVVTQAGDWTVVWRYTFRQSHPRLEVTLAVTPAGGSVAQTLRDLRMEWRFHPEDLAAWCVEAPGNQLRPGVTPPRSPSPSRSPRPAGCTARRAS